MSLDIGDYVSILIPKRKVSDPDEFWYGIITEFQSMRMMTKIELSAEIDKVKYKIMPTYLVNKIKKEEYEMLTNKGWAGRVPPSMQNWMECRHNWVKVGSGPVTNEDWFNCGKCGIRKEDL